MIQTVHIHQQRAVAACRCPPLRSSCQSTGFSSTLILVELARSNASAQPIQPEVMGHVPLDVTGATLERVINATEFPRSARTRTSSSLRSPMIASRRCRRKHAELDKPAELADQVRPG